MTALIQKKSIIVFAIPILLFVVWLNALYLPTNSKIQFAENNLFQLDRDLAQCQATIGEIRTIKGKASNIESELAKCLSEICAVDSISEFIQMVDNDLEDYDIIDRSVTPRLPDLLESDNIDLGEQKLNRVEFNIKGQGEYIQIGKFIEELQKKSFYAGAGNLEIVYNASINPRVLFDMKFSAYLKGWGNADD
jgi:hypothetical protein